ncbi:MAG: NADH:ubiquinone oxidoreductase subunit 6 (subunit J) [Cyclobacteriaceae bacterium]
MICLKLIQRMGLIEALFFVFAGVIVLAVSSMFFLKNIIHASFLLVLSMISLAGIYVLFGAEYLAVVQLLVYAGGIIILLAFGVMLTQQVKAGATPSGHHLVFPALVVAVSAAVSLASTISKGYSGATFEVMPPMTDQVREIGVLLMTDYLLAFELIAFLLLVVLVGASFYAKQSRVS